MDFFMKLGALVDDRWRDRERDPLVFPEIAAGALRELSPNDHLSLDDVTRWLFQTHGMPPQENMDTSFGDPPITVYQGSGFFIDVLVWTESSTDVHQHAFSGAFQMLGGSSLHGTYDFETVDRVNSRLELGHLRLKHFELLGPGEIRPIVAGRRFIHSTFHMDRPSLSVVVRTHVDDHSLPQLSYRRPHLAVAPFALQASRGRSLLVRQMQLLAALQKTQHSTFAPRALELLAGADFESTWWILSQTSRLLPKEAPLRVRLLEAARKRHGSRVDWLVPVLEEEHHFQVLRAKHQLVTQPDHRFLLSLLLHVPGQKQILDMIRQRYPDADPVERITTWLSELAHGSAQGVKILDVPLDDVWLQVLRYLIEGLSVPDIQGELKKEYPEEEVDAQGPMLHQFSTLVRHASLFRPLFQR